MNAATEITNIAAYLTQHAAAAFGSVELRWM